MRHVERAKAKQRESGFTLLETMVSLVILVAALVGIVPIYMVSRLQVIQGEIETGAIAVSKRVSSNLRQEFNQATSVPDDGQPKTALPHSGESIATITHLGKEYNPTITYCNSINASDCGISDPISIPSSARLVQIQVSHNNEPVYATQTIFTKLD